MQIPIIAGIGIIAMAVVVVVAIKLISKSEHNQDED
ncbi:hypothetical protein CLMAG_28230 [Clostridium magnum DSM 2767]|uniref:Uncharacterized protein n=1 Tax=Clostridium magnum DSM 2767 TaxID=1121326 RepID=A0A161Y4E4_9CLOT|nr:hypothetical protein CLMAG_63190 [Clostridium magnum DSM 2767]KZL93009.1 hypothetical protein CLMAG_28230 [Clostridium magnum DSM 2767]